MRSITTTELAFWQAHGFAFDLLDVRRTQARAADPQLIPGAQWRDPAAWLDWKDACLPAQRPLVVYCVHGHEISQGLAAALRAMGLDARFLQGGLAAWKAAGQALATAAAQGPTQPASAQA